MKAVFGKTSRYVTMSAKEEGGRWEPWRGESPLPEKDFSKNFHSCIFDTVDGLHRWDEINGYTGKYDPWRLPYDK